MSFEVISSSSDLRVEIILEVINSLAEIMTELDGLKGIAINSVSYTHLRAHET